MSSPVGANAKRTEIIEQLARFQSAPGRLQQPVGIIGPGDGGERECSAARTVAGLLAQAGFSIICGGRGGVMAAASCGATEAGGIAVGILPEEDARSANAYLTVAVPTGMGEMRNAVIARSSLCLVAIGGGMGTISEMALGLKWNQAVFALYEDVQLPGAVITRDLDDLIARVLAFLSQRAGLTVA